LKRRYQIAVIGDSNTSDSPDKDELAKKLGRALIDNGYRLVTGGLGGVMDAAVAGAKKSKKYQDGDIISILPGFDPTEASNQTDILIVTGLDLARNLIISNSDALIAIGGGSGTLSEMAFGWALKRLILAYEVEGWSGKLANIKIDRRVRYKEILDDRIYGIKTETEALELLKKLLPLYIRYHHGVRQRPIDP